MKQIPGMFYSCNKSRYSKRSTNQEVRLGREARNDDSLLVRINMDAEKRVAEAAECLGTDHTLTEVKGSPHLGHRLDEQHGTAVRVDCLHKSNDLILKSHSLWWTCSR